MQVKLKGVLFCFFLAVPCYFLGRWQPLVGGPIFGILLGMMVAYWQRPQSFNAGIIFTAKKVLQISIICLGFGLNLGTILQVGSASLVLMVFTLAAAFFTAYVVGKGLKLQGNVPILIGVGTAICGGSAIVATAPIVKASDSEVAFSLSTIFLFNVAAVFLFPFFGHLLALSDGAFGMWAGTAINDTSSVVAAGYAYSNLAGDTATVVKLTRTLMIIPVTLFLAFWLERKNRGRENKAEAYAFRKIFPWFILGFLGASLLVTLVDLGVENTVFTIAFSFFTALGKYGIIMAMVAIGLNTKVSAWAKNGLKPVLLGLCCWFVVAVVALICQAVLL